MRSHQGYCLIYIIFKMSKRQRVDSGYQRWGGEGAWGQVMGREIQSFNLGWWNFSGNGCDIGCKTMWMYLVPVKDTLKMLTPVNLYYVYYMYIKIHIFCHNKIIWEEKKEKDEQEWMRKRLKVVTPIKCHDHLTNLITFQNQILLRKRWPNPQENCIITEIWWQV